MSALGILTKKSALLKVRNRGDTAMELIQPLFMVVIMVVLGTTVGRVSLPQRTELGAVNATLGEGCQGSGGSCLDVAYAPEYSGANNSQLVEEVMGYVRAQGGPGGRALKTQVFPSQVALQAHIDANPRQVGLGVVFRNLSLLEIPGVPRLPLHPFVAYRMLVNSSQVFGRSAPLVRTGVLKLQQQLDTALLNVRRNRTGLSDGARIETDYLEMPEPLVNSVAFMYPYYFGFAFSSLLKTLLTMLAVDKENGTRLLLQTMGVSFPLYLGSLCIVAAGQMLLTVGLIAAIVGPSGLFSYTDTTLFLVAMFLFALAQIPLALLLSLLAPKKQNSQTLGDLSTVLLLTVFGLLNYLGFDAEAPSADALRVALLLPHVAFGRLVQLMSNTELERRALTWANASSEVFDAHVSPAACVGFIALDVVVWSVVAVYLNMVLPQEGCGPPKAWDFLWRSSASSNRVADEREWTGVWLHSTSETVAEKLEELKGVTADVDPELRQEETAAVEFDNVFKVYGSHSVQESQIEVGKGSTVAVAGVSLRAEKGQVTTVLGHNGAGKTTLFKCLLGAEQLTSGDIRVLGSSIHREREAVSRQIGVCPQFDTLFELMTARENVDVYAGLAKVEAGKVDELLQRIGLHEKQHRRVKDLSGGEKRRVSIAIAIVQSTEILVLDEPTTGLDPESRSSVWRVIEDQRDAGKAVILTTHSMEEADHLSNVIGIVSSGRLLTLGTPTFLKTHFGVGMRLRVYGGAERREQVLEAARRCVEGMEAVEANDDDADDAGEDVLDVRFPATERVSLGSVGKCVGEVESVDGVRGVILLTTSLEDVFLSLAHRGIGHGDL